MFWLFQIIAVLFFAGEVAAQAYISALSPYQASALNSPTNGNVTMTSVTPSEWLTSDPGTLDLNGVIAAWSGGYKAITGTKLFLHGGGHSDSANNGTYVYDFSGTTAPTGWSVVAQSTVANIIVASQTYADGRPTAIHTYDGSVMANNGYLYRFGGSGYDGMGGGFAGNSAFKYNISTNTWTHLTDVPGGGPFYKQTFYDPASGKILITHGVSFLYVFFRTADDTYSTPHDSSIAPLSSDSTGCYDSSRSRGIHIGGNSPNLLYTINWSAETVTTASLSASGSTGILDTHGISCFYDSARDVYWIFGGRYDSAGWTNFYEMNASTFAVTAHALTGASIQVDTGNFMAGSWGRFVFLSSARAIGLVAHANSPAYIIKLPAASGGDTTPPSDPTALNATPISSSQINLSWTASTDDTAVTGYNVERCTGNACVNFIEVYTPATNSQSDTGRTSSTLYRYRVRAHDAAGNLSGYSSIAQATTSAGGSLPVGILIQDGPATPEQIALILPVTGTLAQTATATVRYKPSASGTWITGHPLYRIRPTLSEAPIIGSVPDAFAWPIIDLTPCTAYDVEVTATDDTNTSIQSITSTTRCLPTTAGAPNKTITAGSSQATIQTAINGLVAGDVLQFQNGTYNVASLSIARTGTIGSPIYIRGQSRAGVILHDNGRVLQIGNSSDIVIENLTITGSGTDGGVNSASVGIEFLDSGTISRLTVRNVTMTGVDRAVGSAGYVGPFTGSGFLIYDNTFTGNNLWAGDNCDASGNPSGPDGTPDIDQNCYWDDDGIEIGGLGNVAFNNTLTGFGDTFAYASTASGDTNTINIGIHFYRNEIRNGGDDGMTEADHAFRNNSFYDNRSHNTMTCLSLDPLYGGPFLYARNICINPGRQPFKWNSAQSGQFIYSNTIIDTTSRYATTAPSAESGWYNAGNGDQNSIGYRNNILVYRGSGSQTIRLDNGGYNPVDWSYNSWYPNLIFQFKANGYANLAAAQAGVSTTTPVFSGLTKPFISDNITVSNPWTTTITLGSDYHTEVTATYLPTLSGGDAAKNSGIAIDNITDGFSGASPDRGAVIAGRAAVQYGDRSSVIPPPPTGVSIARRRIM
jgi:hypothetical protein